MFHIYALRIEACMMPVLNGCLNSWPTLVCCMMVFSMLCSWSGSIGASLLYTKTKFIIVLQSKTTRKLFAKILSSTDLLSGSGFHPRSSTPGMFSIGICLTPSLKHFRPGYTFCISACFLSMIFFTI